MRTSIPFQSGSREPVSRPFPTRGVAGGWHDPWDADPLAGVVATIRQRNALRRQVTEADVQLELLARARTDGRWEAHVVSPNAAAAPWPSVNGPTAARALDALEAELQELLGQGIPQLRADGGRAVQLDGDLIMRTWRIDCGKATPVDFRKQRNHDIRQWMYRIVGILVLLQILYMFANMSF